ncbi:hypothetical protein IB211_01930c [Intestinimonas butyriciproducens]|uniref:Uncharacterized protein n=1 Tax=Intestinimonas butyriciproducens TaxID=1297617 RepID=A0A0S2W4R3_9FIRM|nr:hypothetical protein IB211_01930c [Intestinimonas butyriciproducens]
MLDFFRDITRKTAFIIVESKRKINPGPAPFSSIPTLAESASLQPMPTAVNWGCISGRSIVGRSI